MWSVKNYSCSFPWSWFSQLKTDLQKRYLKLPNEFVLKHIIIDLHVFKKWISHLQEVFPVLGLVLNIWESAFYIAEF